MMPKLQQSRKRAWIKQRKRQKSFSNNQDFYNSRKWRSLRQYFIQMNPLCKTCEEQGLIVGGQCVDHIRPIRLGGAMLSVKNLQTLCNSCHARKSGEEAHIDKYEL